MQDPRRTCSSRERRLSIHMKNPVRSRHVSSRPPTPHNSVLPGAANSGSREHITDSGKGTHVEVATDEVDIVLSHVCVLSSEQVSGGIAFLGHNIVKVYRAERDRRGA